MIFSRIIRVGVASAVLALSPLVAGAVTVASFTNNDYSSVNLAATTVLPVGASWTAAPSTRAGNLTNTYRSPFDETLDPVYSNASGVPEDTEYFAVGPGNPMNPAILSFAGAQDSFSLLWGSPDGFNELSFYLGGVEVGSFTGIPFAPPLAFGSAYVNFTGLFDEVQFFSDPQNAFEFAALSATPSEVPLPAGAVLILTGLGGFAVMRRRKQQRA